MTTIFDQHIAQLRTDHLFLLVGENPLPNAVAAHLLTHPKSWVHLIHTDRTSAVADQLANWIRKDDLVQGVDKLRVSDSDASDIYDQVFRSANAAARDRASLGLHYTGGTKAMAVHAYRAVESAGRSAPVPPIFTYLNPRELALCVDASVDGRTQLSLPVATAVRFTVKRLIDLHGWQFKSEPDHTPRLPEIATLLAQVHVEKTGREAWHTWVKDVLEKQGRHKNRPNEWKSNTALRGLNLDLPTEPVLQPIVAGLQGLSGDHGSTISIGALARGAGFAAEEKLCRWLHGLWLDHYTLGAVQTARSKIDLDDTLANLEVKTGGANLELDVAAIRGYQFFGISCTTDPNRAKSKLFEVLTRARQLGGDEARVGLVCCHDKPQQLKDQLADDFGADRDLVRVFGAADILDLPEKLAEWIRRSATVE